MIEELSAASCLLVCATEKRHVPGKLFEYLQSGRRILVFGDDNEEVGGILQKANAGKMYSYKNDAGEFFNQLNMLQPDLSTIMQYDRQIIARELSNILSTAI